MLVAGLLALNLLMSRGPQIMVGEAFGQNRGTAGGDYVVAAAKTTEAGQLLYVVDTRTKRMIVYGWGQGRANAEPVDTRDLNREFPGGCSGQLVLQPFLVTRTAEAMAVIDTVNKKMIIYTSTNFGRLAISGSADLGKDLGG